MSTKETKADATTTAKEEAVEQEFFSKQAGETESKSSPEGKNVYEHQMSSTETATLSSEDFWKIKLIS